jgi:hypothetical protein
MLASKIKRHGNYPENLGSGNQREGKTSKQPNKERGIED